MHSTTLVSLRLIGNSRLQMLLALLTCCAIVWGGNLGESSANIDASTPTLAPTQRKPIDAYADPVIHAALPRERGSHQSSPHLSSFADWHYGAGVVTPRSLLDNQTQPTRHQGLLAILPLIAIGAPRRKSTPTSPPTRPSARQRAQARPDSPCQPSRHAHAAKNQSEVANLYHYVLLRVRDWPSRDPIEERGGMNLYAFVGNDGVNSWDVLGMAYFAYRPLGGVLGILGVSDSKADDKLNTVIGHEQIFFEDGKSPSNIGFFDDGTLQTESDTSKYQSAHDSGWNDCAIRKAIKNVPLQTYCLLGKPGATDKFNCQDWVQEVRNEYRKLIKKQDVISECCPSDSEKNK